MDTSKAGQLIAEQMEALDRDFGDREDLKIGGGVSIVLIEGEDGSFFRIRSNMGHPAMTLGAMRMAEDEFLRALREPGGIEREGEDED
ncbi:MAG TPA: hypothetical protein VNV44_03255 [Solirubrobacteraceae bacterium]|jgi:hypothetical protein|nr:hypothetical protein [Solirubrobacteraceae bacterium]